MDSTTTDASVEVRDARGAEGSREEERSHQVDDESTTSCTELAFLRGFSAAFGTGMNAIDEVRTVQCAATCLHLQ